MDGAVPKGMTYDAWLKQQSPETQIEVLGVGKHDLWKDGKITSVKQLIAQKGNELTLQELRDKYGA
jgi:hypothetical protein